MFLAVSALSRIEPWPRRRSEWLLVFQRNGKAKVCLGQDGLGQICGFEQKLVKDDNESIKRWKYSILGANDRRTSSDEG